MSENKDKLFEIKEKIYKEIADLQKMKDEAHRSLGKLVGEQVLTPSQYSEIIVKCIQDSSRNIHNMEHDIEVLQHVLEMFP